MELLQKIITEQQLALAGFFIFFVVFIFFVANTYTRSQKKIYAHLQNLPLETDSKETQL